MVKDKKELKQPLIGFVQHCALEVYLTLQTIRSDHGLSPEAEESALEVYLDNCRNYVITNDLSNDVDSFEKQFRAAYQKLKEKS
ncbi:MAG: hypothetical protein ABH824_00795 [Nanoarchaeota archaeon]|nr:hypothetical protein [Nanoarchaeota archaeon]MBU1632801.1 hypothetical protein [Nanoarchaeota archaeon]MBU1876529.1 hypothetical protein [Nanoarchaeota archaeon]